MLPNRSTILKPLGDRDLFDPLSEVTRHERRNLLLASLVSLALTWSDLIPTSIDALGITVSPTDRESLVFLLGLALLYFSLAFLTYGSADLVRWRMARLAAEDLANEAVQPFNPVLQNQPARDPGANFDARLVDYRIMLGKSAFFHMGVRVAFDLLSPVIAASIAAASVLAQLAELSSPFDLTSIVWSSSPIGCLSIIALLLPLGWCWLFRRSFLVRLRTKSWALRIGSQILTLSGYFPDNGFVRRLGWSINNRLLAFYTAGS